jgi:hypothetical protein
MEPNRELVITLQGRELKCAYPTVGQFIDMKTEEIMLSKNYGKELLMSGLVEEQTAYLMVRAISCINALFPNIKEDLKVASLKDVAISDFEEIYSVYLTKVAPWLQAWQNKFTEALQRREEK